MHVTIDLTPDEAAALRLAARLCGAPSPAVLCHDAIMQAVAEILDDTTAVAAGDPPQVLRMVDAAPSILSFPGPGVE